MDQAKVKQGALLVLAVAAVWVGARYLLPVLLPFGIGLLFALMAEPGVRFLESKLHFSRALASALAVGLGFIMIFVIIWLLGAAVYRELTVLASGLPALFEHISDGAARMKDWAMGLLDRLPDSMAVGLRSWTAELFTNGSVLLERAASGLFGVAGNVVGVLPGSFLTVATAVISSFMISAQLPRIRRRLSEAVLPGWTGKVRPTLKRLKTALGGWLKAQVKLSGVVFLIVTGGLVLLRINNAVFWALIVALVDAVPMLGTGTVLIPWCLVSFLQGENVRAIGLLGLYVTAMLTRSALEPKLVGSHLGINPLLTLLSLYAGYKLWGVGGMILAPILTVMASQLVKAGQ